MGKGHSGPGLDFQNARERERCSKNTLNKTRGLSENIEVCNVTNEAWSMFLLDPVSGVTLVQWF